MGFFDKVKNMFYEDIDDEVKVEQIKSDVTHVAIESPVEDEATDPITREILQKFKEEPKQETIDTTEEDEIQTLFFDDDDFNDLDYKEEEKEEEKPDFYEKPPLYREIKEEVHEETKFKPTPIISPVYGVLDKNYHKEDIVSKDEVKYQQVEDPVDSIRNKAYGTLEDELENTMFGQNSILFKSTTVETPIEDTDSLLDEFADDIGKELDELLDKKTRSQRYDDIIDEMDTTKEEEPVIEESENFFDVEKSEDLKDPDFDVDLIDDAIEDKVEEDADELIDNMEEEPKLEDDEESEIFDVETEWKDEEEPIEPELELEEEKEEQVEEKFDDIDDDDLLGFINSTLYNEGEDE